VPVITTLRLLSLAYLSMPLLQNAVVAMVVAALAPAGCHCSTPSGCGGATSNAEEPDLASLMQRSLERVAAPRSWGAPSRMVVRSIQDAPSHPGPSLAYGSYFICIGIVSWMIFLSLAVLMIYFSYHSTCSWVGSRPDPEELGRVQHPTVTFEKHLFDSYGRGAGTFEAQQFESCLTCCCLGVRWADTLNKASLLPYWQAFGLIAGLGLLNYLHYGFYCWGVFTAAAMFWYRQKLREKFGLPAWDARTMFCDFCYVCWCPCCAVMNEAKAVREAYIKGLDGFETQKGLGDLFNGELTGRQGCP